VNLTRERTAEARNIDTTRSPAASGTDRPQDQAQPARETVPTDTEAVAQADETTQEPGLSAARPALVRGQRPTPLVATRRPSRGTAEPPEATSNEAAIETHHVQAGDTLSSLAERYYGSAKHTRFLAEANPQIGDPNVLRIGTVVKIVPLPADGTAARPSRAPASDAAIAGGQRTYRVKAGDSFYSIARDVLGDAKRWQEVLDLNRDAVSGDPTHLQIGQVLVLPRQ
jgi:nucleoid-associated protein YgaU